MYIYIYIYIVFCFVLESESSMETPKKSNLEKNGPSLEVISF